MKIYFDLSTSARWSGHVVGIVRVERELARRLPPTEEMYGGFCLYVPRENGIRMLCRDIAQDIIAGRVIIDFDGQMPGRRGAPGKVSVRRRIRKIMLDRPKLYRFVQKLRGRSFSLEQIEDVRRAERAAELAELVPGPKIVTVDEIAPDRLELNEDILIISGGLDWEHKNIRGLQKMKAAHKFQYAAIIYDLIPIKFPHYVVPAYVNLLRDYFGELFWLTDYALSISACTHRDMLEYCKDWGIPKPASDHFPLGGDLSNPRSAEGELPEALKGKRYAIFVSTIEPRKNHRTLYQAWDMAIRRGLIDPETCRLVFVGMWGWNTGDVRNEMAANPMTRETIVTLAGVSDSELSMLYRNAEFSLFPSYYEGYGLPVAEALSYGVPCICSNAGSLPEIAGDLIAYYDPSDPQAWMNAISEAFAKPAAIRIQSEKIKASFKAPTWDMAAQQFYAKLTRLVEERAA